jgi:hypothetical protein
MKEQAMTAPELLAGIVKSQEAAKKAHILEERNTAHQLATQLRLQLEEKGGDVVVNRNNARVLIGILARYEMIIGMELSEIEEK